MRQTVVRAVTALVSLLLVLVTAPALASGPRPDLVVQGVALGGTDVPAGETIDVRAVVKNTGRGAVGRSRATLYLSKDQKHGKSDKALRTVKVHRLAAGGKVTIDVTVRTPATTRSGDYRVLVCADARHKVRETRDGNNCATSGPLAVRALSSGDLIDRAVAAGKLDDETALVYKVFASVDDPRLPGRYAGDDSATLDSPLSEVVDRWSDLSVATRELLEPFVIPPFYEGSHWTPASAPARAKGEPELGGFPTCDSLTVSLNWFSELSANGKVRIWWSKGNDPTDRPTALKLLDAVDTKIWPAITSLMGKEPKTDDAGPCSGPDGALDVIMVDIDTDSTMKKSILSCDGSTHILLKRRPDPTAWLAHELFHAVQFSYPVKGACDDYKWLREATAQWFMDYVSDPSYGIGVTPDDAEWLYDAPQLYLDRPHVSLDSLSPKHHEYGSYLFYFYLARRHNPGLVPAIWSRVATMSGVEATKDAVGAGFDDDWLEFVTDNWNRGGLDAYRTWDGLTSTAKPEGEYELDEAKATTTIKVDHLAAKYYTYTPAKNVTSLHFENASPSTAGAGVQAIIEYADGTTKVQDWSGRASVDLCLTAPEVASVTLVFSNSKIHPADELSFDITIEGQAGVCCTAQDSSSPRTGAAAPAAATSCPDAHGTVVYTETRDFQTAPGGCCNQSSTLTVTLHVLMRSDDAGGWVDDGSTYTVDYQEEQSGRDVDCDYSGSWTGSGAGPVDAGAGDIVEKGQISPISGQKTTGREWLLSVSHAFHADVTGTESWSCENGGVTRPDEYSLDPEIWVADDCPGYPYLWFKGAADATDFSYSCNRPEENGTTRTTTATIGLD